MALSLAKRINASAAELELLNSSFSKDGRIETLTNKSNSRSEIILQEADFKLMSEWRYFAFMSLTRTSDFKSEPKWIASRLGIPELEVKEMIELLAQKGMIALGQGGSIRDNNSCYRSPEDFPTELIRSRQRNGLDYVSQLLKEGDSLQFGCFSTITNDTQKLETAKTMIEDFLRRLSIFLSEGTTRDEVFELQIQLFPRTHR